MIPTLFDAMFEIIAAIAMVTVAFALLLWFRRSQVVASVGRLTGMMTRVGLDPGIAGRGGPRTTAILNQARRRCRKCPHEDICDRWLAGALEGDNSFCPNAQTFGSLA